MRWVVWILLAIIGGGLLTVVLLILLLPFTYGLQISYERDRNYRVHLGSFLFAIRVEKREGPSKLWLKVLGVKFSPKKRERKEKKEKSQEKKKKASPFVYIKALKKESISHLLLFFSDLLKILSPHLFQLHVSVGFYEMELNGICMALFSLLKEVLPGSFLTWETLWEEEGVTLHGEIQGEVVPAVMLWRILFFLFSKETRRFLFTFFRERRAVKKEE